jgi:hypothetical protein
MMFPSPDREKYAGTTREHDEKPSNKGQELPQGTLYISKK